jgi:MYXO-CTERM domain-containing protein
MVSVTRQFEVHFESQAHIVNAGVPFVFTDYVSGGVEEFFVTGFDPAELLDRTAPAPFVHGFRFADEGPAFVFHGAVAPGNYDWDGYADAADYIFWKSSFGSANFRADGNQDGAVDSADYVVWRKRLTSNESAIREVNSAVPEPTALALAALALALLVLRRK